MIEWNKWIGVPSGRAQPLFVSICLINAKKWTLGCRNGVLVMQTQVKDGQNQTADFPLRCAFNE